MMIIVIQKTDTKAMLNAAGLRRTPVRAGVLDALVAAQAGARGPMSVQEVVEFLPADTDVVTVYRTLNTLVEKGMAQRVRGDDRSWLYELGQHGKPDDSANPTGSAHAHAHFFCDGCGKIECLPDMKVENALALSGLLKPGYAVRDQEVTVRGTCATCGVGSQKPSRKK